MILQSGPASIVSYDRSQSVLESANVQDAIDEIAGLEERWFKTTLPISYFWSGIAYGNGLFVAVACDGLMNSTNTGAYSTDGERWTLMTMPAERRWSGIVFGNGRFVASAYGTTSCAYSDDGITWTEITTPEIVDMNYAIYGNGKFVVPSASGDYVLYSEDGVSWSKKTPPAKRAWRKAAYGNGKFVLIAANSAYGAYSADGMNWVEMELPAERDWDSIVFGDGRFVAAARLAGYSAYSTDGIAWSETTFPMSAYGVTLIYENGKYLALICDQAVESTRPESFQGPTIYFVSIDGINWSERRMPNGYWINAAYGNGRLVAVCYYWFKTNMAALFVSKHADIIAERLAEYERGYSGSITISGQKITYKNGILISVETV